MKGFIGNMMAFDRSTQMDSKYFIQRYWVIFTATVTGSTPNGFVEFYDDLSLLDTGKLNGAFEASFTTNLLTDGAHAITAVYLGDANNDLGYSNQLTHDVEDARPGTTTALALTAVTKPSASGASVTFTATVTGSAPSGDVVFYDGSTLLGTATLNGSAQAALTTSTLPVGWRPITARYLGDAANAPSATSTSLFQTVNPSAGNGKLKVFILAGQSNMQGKAPVEVGRDPNNYNVTNFPGGLGRLRNMLNREPNRYGYLDHPCLAKGIFRALAIEFSLCKQTDMALFLNHNNPITPSHARSTPMDPNHFHPDPRNRRMLSRLRPQRGATPNALPTLPTLRHGGAGYRSTFGTHRLS